MLSLLNAALLVMPKWLLLAVAIALTAMCLKLQYEVNSVRTEKAELDVQLAQANAKNAELTVTLQSNVLKAQANAKARELPLRMLADSARNESNSLLRDLEAARAGYANATRQAAIDRGIAIGAVLGQCAQEYQDLARRSDIHVNDLRTMIEAWPMAPAKQ